VLLGLLFGVAGLANSSAALSLNSIAGDLEVSKGVATWSVTLYALVLSVGTAVYGRLADRHGFRRPLATGVVLLAAGSVIAALAPTFAVHIVGRIVQGLGAGAIPTLGMAVVNSRYRDLTRSSALVTLSVVGIVAGAVGPLAVGSLLDVANWRWAVGLSVIGLILLVPVWGALGGEAVGASLDLVGAFLVTVTASGAMLLLSSPATGALVAVIGGVLLCGGLPLAVVWFRTHPDGFLPRAVTRSTVVFGPAVAASALTASWYALLVALPWELSAEGWSNVAIGFALVPGAVVGVALRGRLTLVGKRLGSAGSLSRGMLITGVALALAASGVQWHQPVLLVAAGVAVPLAFSLGQPALITLSTDRVTLPDRGVALGVATLIFMMGGAAGSAVVGGFGPIWGNAVPLAALAGITLAGAAVAARITGRPPPRKPART